MSEYARFTITLDEIVNEMEIDIFDFEYTLPEFVNKTELQNMFIRTYLFREIGSETITRWKIQLQNMWLNLCYKYQDLFVIFEKNYLADNVFDNNNLDIERERLFQDTPQSMVSIDKNYITDKTNENTTINGMAGSKYRYELLKDYGDKIRHIYYEFVSECEPLFMQIF